MDYVQATHSYRDARDGEVWVWDGEAGQHCGDRGSISPDIRDSHRYVRSEVLIVCVSTVDNCTYMWLVKTQKKAKINSQKKNFLPAWHWSWHYSYFYLSPYMHSIAGNFTMAVWRYCVCSLICESVRWCVFVVHMSKCVCLHKSVGLDVDVMGYF